MPGLVMGRMLTVVYCLDLLMPGDSSEADFRLYFLLIVHVLLFILPFVSLRLSSYACSIDYNVVQFAASLSLEKVFGGEYVAQRV